MQKDTVKSFIEQLEAKVGWLLKVCNYGIEAFTKNLFNLEVYIDDELVNYTERCNEVGFKKPNTITQYAVAKAHILD